MLTRRELFISGLKMGAGLTASSVAAGLLTGCPHQAHGSPPNVPAAERITRRASLRAHAAAHGLLMGAAVNVRILNSEPDYARTLAEQFNLVVAENAMKWGPLRPAPARYNFEEADQLVAFAAQHNMRVRGHNLCWHENIPAWFASTVTKENARQFLTDHIMTVAGRYKGKIQSWDVVNEAILPQDGRDDGLRKSPWFELLGPEYIDIAFRTARQADPNARLTYNDYGIEYDSDEDEQKRGFVLQLLRRMKADNVPLDALGIQSHVKAGSPYKFGKGIRDFMAGAREMGLEIYLTELDVNEDDLPFDDVAQRDHAIAEVYRDYLTTTLADPAVKAVLTWGVTDRYTWLNGGPTHHRKQPNRPQRSLLFDNDYHPKENFFAVRDCFDQRKTSA